MVFRRDGGAPPIPHKVAGYRTHVYGAGKRLALEGRAGCNGALAVASELPAVIAAATDALRRLDPTATFCGIGRVDPAVTLRFADPRKGALTLAALASLGLPRCETI